MHECLTGVLVFDLQAELERDEDVWPQRPVNALCNQAGVAPEEFPHHHTSSSLQRIFILNQKAHYSTCRLTCPLNPAET